jgi:Domain of Unknown Function (DUF928)
MSMMKMKLPQISFQKFISLARVFAVILVSATGYPIQGLAQLPRSLNDPETRLRFIPQEKPPFDGTPVDQGAGSSRSSCVELEDRPPLTTLRREIISESTVTEKPTLWFYIPYSSQDIVRIEFELLDDQNHRVQDRLIDSLPDNPNFVSIQLQLSPSQPLKLDREYEWNLYVYCNSGDTVSVTGKILYQSSTTLSDRLQDATTIREQIRIYADNGIWYDALDRLANLRCQEPQNSALAADWVDLLTSVSGLEKIAQQTEFRCYRYSGE